MTTKRTKVSFNLWWLLLIIPLGLIILQIISNKLSIHASNGYSVSNGIVNVRNGVVIIDNKLYANINNNKVEIYPFYEDDANSSANKKIYLNENTQISINGRYLPPNEVKRCYWYNKSLYDYDGIRLFSLHGII